MAENDEVEKSSATWPSRHRSERSLSARTEASELYDQAMRRAVRPSLHAGTVRLRISASPAWLRLGETAACLVATLPVECFEMAKILTKPAALVAADKPQARPPPMPPAERRAMGKKLRDTVSRDAHARLASARGSSRSDRLTPRGRCDAAGRSGADTLWPDVAVPVHLLPWVRSSDGR